MEKFVFIESNIEIIDQIVKTTGLVVPEIIGLKEINSVVFITFKNIMEFIDSILKILPDINIDNGYNKELNIRLEILKQLSVLSEIWESFPIRNDEINDTWMYFTFWWEEYINKSRILKNSETSLFLSMN